MPKSGGEGFGGQLLQSVQEAGGAQDLCAGEAQIFCYLEKLLIPMPFSCTQQPCENSAAGD